jgi:hypothetical protein
VELSTYNRNQLTGKVDDIIYSFKENLPTPTPEHQEKRSKALFISLGHDFRCLQQDLRLKKAGQVCPKLYTDFHLYDCHMELTI